MKRIGIYGIGGLYNFGCEAIIRGTVEFIKKRYENPEISYYSMCYEYDKKQISDLDINIVNITPKRNLLKRIINKLFSMFNIPYIPFQKKEYRKVISNSDIIFSIGGDIYTIPKYLRSKKKYRYINRMVEFGELAKKNKKEVIIYGASIGPFGEYHKAQRYFIEHLKKVDQIICREQSTITYLKENGVYDNVVFLPDPAFIVEFSKDVINHREYIGINLSELSLSEIYGKVDDESVSQLCRVIEKIYYKLKCPIMFIPHVLSPYTKIDNDKIFLERIYNNLIEEVKANAKLVEPKGFNDAKNYLSQCKFVICARMHCAINSIIIGTPAIFLSYSDKSRGMSRYIYGNEKWILQLENINKDLLKKIIKMNEDLTSIDKQITNKIEDVNLAYNNYFIENNIK